MAQIQGLLDQSEAEDVAEDERYGVGRRQFELPDELKHKESRLARLKEARARLEESALQARAEALRSNAEGLRERAATTDDSVEQKRKLTNAAKAEQQADELAPQDDDDEDPPPTTLPTHRPKTTREGKPKPKQQTNFIDPDSKLMKGRDGGFVQAYNVQIAVDEGHQVIVAQGVSNLAPDQPYLEPMARRIVSNLGKAPKVLTADAGYWSDAGVEAVESLGSKALVAVSRGRKTERPPPGATGPPPQELTGKNKMRWKLNEASNREVYRMRKATVEPVFGQVKEARGFRQFSFRGLQGVRQEWDLICAVHNILKLFRHRTGEPATA